MRIVRCRGTHPTRDPIHATRIVTNPKELTKNVAKELAAYLRRLGAENVRWTCVGPEQSANGLDWHLPTHYAPGRE